MKWLKSFLLFESKLSFKTPEYEFKEFYRLFKRDNLFQLLPPEIDRDIFTIKFGGTGYDGEPEFFELHKDPPSIEGEVDTRKFIQLLKKEGLEGLIPLVLFCKELFSTGRVIKIPLKYIRENFDKFPHSDLELIVKDPHFIKKSKEAYLLAKKRGIDLYKRGIIKKFPLLPQAQWWDYAKSSIEHFDRMYREEGRIPRPQMLRVGDKYYMIGGRRRMNWHFYKGIDPEVWVIEMPLSQDTPSQTWGTSNQAPPSWQKGGIRIEIGDVLDHLDEKGIGVSKVPIKDIFHLCIHKGKVGKEAMDRSRRSDLSFPILILKKGGKYHMILDGHHRLLRAKNNKITHIRARVFDLEDTPPHFIEVFS